MSKQISKNGQMPVLTQNMITTQWRSAAGIGNSRQPYMERPALNTEHPLRAIFGADLADIDRVFAECEAPAFSNVSRTGAIQFLNHHQVRGVLNASRCGLALSAEEGAMYASAEYLLCGLPVVTTASRGGRHEFFHGDYVDVVEDTADAVAAGVARMIARDIDPNMIRKRTLLLMREHRGRMLMRLSALLQANLFPQEEFPIYPLRSQSITHDWTARPCFATFSSCKTTDWWKRVPKAFA